MQNKEKIEFLKSVQNYIEKNQIVDLFEKLTQELILKKPEDPIQYLIDFLQNPNKFKRLIIFFDPLEDKQQAESISLRFNFKHLNLKQMIEEEYKNQELTSYKFDKLNSLDDSKINDVVYQNYILNENNYKGILISGYPQNLSQSVFLQEKGIIPEKIFILNYKDQQILDYYQKQLEQDNKNQNENEIQNVANLLLDNFKLQFSIDFISLRNLKQINQSSYNMTTQIDCSEIPKDQIFDKIINILQLKDKSSIPLRSLRILLLRPPKLKYQSKQLSSIISSEFDLEDIISWNSIKKEIDKKSQVGKYSDYVLKKSEQIPEDIICTLIKSNITNVKSKMKGWILSGFPKNKSQLNKFEAWNLRPNLVIQNLQQINRQILVLDDNEQILLEQIKLCKQDPQTKFIYDKNQIDQIKCDDLRNRLCEPANFDDEFLLKEIRDYKELCNQILEQYDRNRVLFYRIDKDQNEKILKDVNTNLRNPSIYY